MNRSLQHAVAGMIAIGVGAALTTGCSTKSAVKPAAAGTGSSAGSAGGSNAKIAVVAAENFWGSIALQLGGAHVAETSIITNPDTDPHSYEATPNDAKLIAGARLFIQNGIGYDTSWAPKLVSANPAPGRDVLTVGDVVGPVLPTLRTFVITDVVRVRGARLRKPLQPIGGELRVYDNGNAQIYRIRSRSPYQD